MILRAAMRPADDYDAETRHLEVQCDDYADGVAQLDAQVPDGWRKLHIIVDRG